MVKIALDNGDFPVVVALDDGPLKEDFLELGVTVIIDGSIQAGHRIFEKFARNFDLVIANTAGCYNVINLLNDSMPPVIWWIHEGSYVLKTFAGALPKRLGKNIRVYSISDYTTQRLRDLHVPYDIKQLTWGIEDIGAAEKLLPRENGAMIFVISGSFEKRKGQDIVLDAIKKLNVSVRKQSEFIFVGNSLDERIYKQVVQFSREYPVRCIGTLPREEALELYRQADCLIIPSRDEPVSLVAVEGMMLSRAVICSDRTGVSPYIRQGAKGLIFRNEDSTQLAERLSFAIENRDKMEQIGREGRRIYEQQYRMEKFRDCLLNIIDELTGRPSQ
jgi:glycosyltransferase involved in cell wall biosynthesis